MIKLQSGTRVLFLLKTSLLRTDEGTYPATWLFGGKRSFNGVSALPASGLTKKPGARSPHGPSRRARGPTAAPARASTAAPRAHQRSAAERATPGKGSGGGGGGGSRTSLRPSARPREGSGGQTRPQEGGACSQRAWKKGLGNGGCKTLPVWKSLGQ